MTESNRRIDEAVDKWLRGAPGALDGLTDDERRSALVQLGYSTPWHLAMFGL